MTQNPYALWRQELANPTAEADRMTRPTDPLALSGFWRINAARMLPDYPVAIWTKDGAATTIFQIGRKLMNTDSHPDEWQQFINSTWLKCTAVTREAWDSALKSDFWADGKAARTMTAEEKLGIDLNPGDNNAPVEEVLADQITAIVDKVKACKVTDQASADVASGLLDKLRALLERAEAERVREKEPHLEGGRKVDAKWKSIREPGLSAGETLKKARDTWLAVEQRRLNAIAAEETRKRQQEADAAAEAERERLRQEAEQHGQPVDEQEIEQRVAEVVQPVEVVQPERAKASSAYGRGTTAKKVEVARVTDAMALVGWFLRSDAPDADFAEYLADRARKSMRAKISLPGVEVRTVEEWAAIDAAPTKQEN